MDLEPFVERFKSPAAVARDGTQRPQTRVPSDSGPYQNAAVGTVLAGEAPEYLEDRLQRRKH